MSVGCAEKGGVDGWGRGEGGRAQTGDDGRGRERVVVWEMIGNG